MKTKRIISLVLVLIICLGLCACGRTQRATNEDAGVSNIANPRSDNTLNISQPTEEFENTKPNKEENVDAMLSVEDFELIKIENNEIWFKVKIRNISDTDLEHIAFDYQVLDKNGDILCDQTCGASNVAAGQAIWAGQYRTHDLSNAEDATAICFVSSPSWTQTKTPLREKVVFQFNDYM